MQATQNLRKCQKHQLDCLAISYQYDQEEDKYMCLRCLQKLLNNNNIDLIEDAQNDFEDAKERYKNTQQSEIQENIAILKRLESQVKSLRSRYIDSLDQINDRITKFIALFEIEQNELTKDDQFTLDDYLHSKSEFKEWQFNFEELFNNIKNDLSDVNKTYLQNRCISTLQQLNCQDYFYFEKKSEQNLPLMCRTHNKEIFFVEENDDFLACTSCVAQKTQGKYIELDKYKQKWLENQEYRKKVLKVYLENRRKKIDEAQVDLRNYQQSIQSTLSEINCLITQYDQLKYDQKEWNSLTDEEILNIDINEGSDEGLENIKEEIELEEEEIDQQLEQVMEDYFVIQESFQEKIYNLIDIKDVKDDIQNEVSKLNDSDDSNSDSEIYSQSSCEIECSSDEEPQQGPELAQSSALNQHFPSYAMAFSKNSRILIAGYKQFIEVFNFEERSKFRLAGHTSEVVILIFLKNQDQFISGSFDGELRLWNNYQCVSILQDGHSSWISQIIMNSSQDIVITCSSDKLIKIWSENLNEWKCTQTLSFHNDCVKGISLNQSDTQLVSCGLDKLIIISEKNSQQIWQKKQIIQINEIGLRISYFQDNFITFQSQYSKHLTIFKKKLENQEFEVFQKLQYKPALYLGCYSWFPQIYNSRTNLLVNKSGNMVYLISQDKNENFFIKKQIRFSNYLIFGALTNDGNKMITWDAQTRGFMFHRISFK